MKSPLASLIDSGTKLWLDSVDPDLIAANRALGATGATSNPIIICDLIKSGRYDRQLSQMLGSQGINDDEAAWRLTDQVVSQAEQVFLPTWESTRGNDGYVSFELDPLLEDEACPLSPAERAARYVELGIRWSKGHRNRMIKVPATPAGITALEPLCAAGVSLNVTLVFTQNQYRAARDAVWRGARKRGGLAHFKSVYSIFVSRVDVYAEQHVLELSPAARGQVGLVNAKQIWQENWDFWQSHATPLDQEIVFASTGVKNAHDPPWKYVAALAGSDIQTNPPATNAAIEASGQTFTRTVDLMPGASILEEIAARVDMASLERTLMQEGLAKFAQPQHDLLAIMAEKRQALAD